AGRRRERRLGPARPSRRRGQGNRQRVGVARAGDEGAGAGKARVADQEVRAGLVAGRIGHAETGRARGGRTDQVRAGARAGGQLRGQAGGGIVGGEGVVDDVQRNVV